MQNLIVSFMGIFLDFFKKNIKIPQDLEKNIFNDALTYLSSRQVAGKVKKKSKKYKSFNKQISLKTRVKKYLFIQQFK